MRLSIWSTVYADPFVFCSPTTAVPSAAPTATFHPNSSLSLPSWMPLSVDSSLRQMSPASSWPSGMNVTVSSPALALLTRCWAPAATRDCGEVASTRRVMDRIGTSAAAVPAAMTSEKTYHSLLDLPAEAARNVLDAVARDAVDDALGVRHDERDVVVALLLDADEAARAELVNVLVPDAVEVQRDAVALGAGAVAEAQDGRVVAADLGVPRAVGGGAVKVVEDEGVDRVGAVVDARGDDEDGEDVLLGRVQAELGRRAVQLRADVHGGARLVGRDVAGVEGDGGLAGGEEEVLGHAGHGGDVGRVLQAHGVLARAEDVDGLVPGGAEGLEALLRAGAMPWMRMKGSATNLRGVHWPVETE
ncbi:hypothetical protein CTA1_2783 [Colletotrichum tanaceti]|uniref:Uncharacterized protein n=1 Tax=Colletotrichum tanaceti TaxID=1306861 RepID=A0A4U6XBK8_9PEZI|nr:hypothetical protein CTA1_2783 [Colletotrichum tanaceti]